MKKQTYQQHMIDILFVLSLFCVFAVSSALLILFGADIYKKTVQQMENSYSTRTSIAYITEKIRQSDIEHAIKIISQDDTQILMLTNIINNVPYATSLYEYDGYLYELFARTDLKLPLDAGQPIMELHSLSFSQIEPNILEITLSIDNESIQTIYVSTHSNMEVKHE
ncbi:MAG: DUF4860 domain-containing protein [Lachnospiraceae bacterium]|nr:DUF4860 domain-containing protein [Lachnospiraceae bacterium]